MVNFLIRPVELKDAEDISKLAQQVGLGMTSLTDDIKLLKQKIQHSINSFQLDPIEIGNELYFFVLEDLSKQHIIGTAAIRARVGGFEPFYSYQIKTAKHDSEALNIHKEIPYLELCKEYNGPSIISSLFIQPECRKSNLGRLLSLSRFMFIADHKDRFTDEIIAEMRGFIENNQSPFWENLVKPFFDMEFKDADHLSAKDKGFIADLMPKHPIYIHLLKPEIIECIGKVHQDTELALKFLLEEGFQRDGYVDIFDAGPRVKAKISNLKTIQNSQLLKVKEIKTKLTNPKYHLVSNARIKFKASYIELELNPEGALIDSDSAQILDLKEGDNIRIL